jgi:acyl-CoA synthetase (AMP-forming)/AMP-acid ligase II
VADVVVVGLRHERWTEAITSLIVPKPGIRIDERELLASVRAHLGPSNVPNAVIVVGDLPNTSTGKIHKKLPRDT